jgi:hypothetical protein
MKTRKTVQKPCRLRVKNARMKVVVMIVTLILVVPITLFTDKKPWDNAWVRIAEGDINACVARATEEIQRHDQQRWSR